MLDSTCLCEALPNELYGVLTLLHTEKPKLYGVFAFLSATGLKANYISWPFLPYLFTEVDGVTFQENQST